MRSSSGHYPEDRVIEFWIQSARLYKVGAVVFPLMFWHLLPWRTELPLCGGSALRWRRT